MLTRIGTVEGFGAMIWRPPDRRPRRPRWAFHLFAWAEELLADEELVAGDGEAARLVSYIRADETPHVEYLRTALSEMRERTFVTESGGRIPGREVVDRLWQANMEESLGPLEAGNRATTVREVELAVAGRRDRSDLLAEFHALGDQARS